MKYKLNDFGIGAACEDVNAYLLKKKTASKNRIQTTFSLEEVLLNYRSVFGADAEFTIDYGIGLSKYKIRLTVPGESVDPFNMSGTASDEERFMQNALTRMGQLPKWKYEHGVNTILYARAKRSIPDWGKLLIAIIAAVVLGMIVRTLPENISLVLQQDIVAPLLDTFLGFLNAVAGPMIFLSVVWGIYSVGDASTFSEIGRRLCIRFLLLLCFFTVLIALVSLLFFSLKSGNAQDGNQFSELYHMVLDVIPDNLITPFSSGNTLQILFVGFIVGITMLVVGKNVQSVADLTEQFGVVVDGIMGFIGRLVPIFVFGSLFNTIVGSDRGSISAGGKFLAGTLLGCLFLLLIHTVITSIRIHISPLDLWKRTFSTFLIAVSTASSTAAFAESKKTCTEKLGVDSRLANFGVPFGQLLYPPAVAALFWFAAVSVAENRQVEVSLSWYVTAVLISIILAVASPPVPGGLTASFTILFAQLSLPMAELGVIVSLTSILDFVATATDVYSRQCILAMAARDMTKRKMITTESSE